VSLSNLSSQADTCSGAGFQNIALFSTY